MKNPKIAVTGATGKTGAAVALQLLELNWPVRALVHRRDARSEHLEKMGAEIVIADLFDYDQMVSALRGTERAYFCPPFHPHMIGSATTFALAARETRLEAVVGLSQWLASPTHPSLATRNNWLADHLFALLPDTAHVIVNPGYFADNYLRLIDFAALLGIFPILTGHSRNAPPSNEDIARVAVASLMEPERHAGQSYRPTGPQLLSAHEMAAILQKVLAHRVRPIEMPLWMFLKAARLQGVSAFELSGLRYYIEDHKAGAFERGAPNDDILLVTGRAPESFEATARRYAASPRAQRTGRNRARAVANFMRVPLTPGYNLDRFERQQLFPLSTNSLLAMDNEVWKAEHRA